MSLTGLLSILWWLFFKWLSDKSTRGRYDKRLNKVKQSEENLLPLENLKRSSPDTSVPWRTLFSHPSFWQVFWLTNFCFLLPF